MAFELDNNYLVDPVYPVKILSQRLRVSAVCFPIRI